MTMTEKTRYTDEELDEFRDLILQKLDKAKDEYAALKASITNSGRLAQRQMKFIQNLQAALIRIENKTYGICRETGKLIPKERLRAVPHATLSIEAKTGGSK